MGLLHYLIAVVCQWLSDACQNEQFLALHDGCWGKRVNQHRSVAASHTTHTEKLKLIYTERLRLSSTSTISQYWAYQPCVRVTQQKQQYGIRPAWGSTTAGGRWAALWCLWLLLEELMRCLRTARDPTRFLSLLFSNFCRTNTSSLSGKVLAGKQKGEEKKESKHHLRYHEAGLLQATHVGFFVVVIFVVEKHHSHTPDF